jgi:hypothetical protein
MGIKGLRGLLARKVLAQDSISPTSLNRAAQHTAIGTRSRISRSSWYLLALENSLDFNRTCKLAIASSRVAIAAEKSDLHFLK